MGLDKINFLDFTQVGVPQSWVLLSRPARGCCSIVHADTIKVDGTGGERQTESSAHKGGS